MKKLLAITLVIIGSGCFGKSASAEIGIGYFLNNFKGDKNTRFQLLCFQNGKQIITENGLYIRRVTGKLTNGNSFTRQNGEIVEVFLSKNTATTCLVKQITR